MKNRLFSFKLYKDGLRQLSLTGIILCILTFMSMALPAFVELFKHARYRVIGHVELDINTYSGLLIGLFLFMGIGSFVLPYVMFSFLNKRNASDFYDSLPNSRQCTFVSLALAAVTWIWATIIVTMSGFGVACKLFGVITVLVPSLKLTLMFMLGSLYIAASTMIGITSTGTFFTGIITSCLVICFPRYIISYFQVIAIEFGRIIRFSALPEIFNPQLNLFWNLPLSALFGMSVDSLVVNRVLPYIFTFVLSVVYLAIAAVIYIRRKSETAEKSAPNRFTQNIFRCALTFPVISIPCALAVLGEGDIEFAIVMLIVSALVYFIYEAVTTKNWKSVLKSAPVFVILFVFTLGVTLISVSAGRNMKNYVPKTENIKYITVSETYHDYYHLKVKDIKLTSEDAKNYIIDILKANQSDDVNEYEKRTTYYYSNSRYGKTVTVNFVMSNGRNVERFLVATAKELEDIDELKKQSDDYETIINKVPSIDEIDGIAFHSNYFDVDVTSKEDIESIFEAYIKDYENINHFTDGYIGYDSIAQLEINGEIDGYGWYESIEINSSCPALYDAFISLPSVKLYCQNLVTAIETTPHDAYFAYMKVANDTDTQYIEFGNNSDSDFLNDYRVSEEVLKIMKRGAERILTGESLEGYYFANCYAHIHIIPASVGFDEYCYDCIGETPAYLLFTDDEINTLQSIFQKDYPEIIEEITVE